MRIFLRKKISGKKAQDNIPQHAANLLKGLKHKILLLSIDIEDTEESDAELIVIHYDYVGMLEENEDLGKLIKEAVAVWKEYEVVGVESPVPFKRIEATQPTAQQGVYCVDSYYARYVAREEIARQDLISIPVKRVILGMQEKPDGGGLSYTGKIKIEPSTTEKNVGFDRSNIFHCFAYALTSPELCRAIRDGEPAVELVLLEPERVVVRLDKEKEFSFLLPAQGAQTGINAKKYTYKNKIEFTVLFHSNVITVDGAQQLCGQFFGRALRHVKGVCVNYKEAYVRNNFGVIGITCGLEVLTPDIINADSLKVFLAQFAQSVPGLIFIEKDFSVLALDINKDELLFVSEKPLTVFQNWQYGKLLDRTFVYKANTPVVQITGNDVTQEFEYDMVRNITKISFKYGAPEINICKFAEPLLSTLTPEQERYLDSVSEKNISAILSKCQNYEQAVVFFRAVAIEVREETLGAKAALLDYLQRQNLPADIWLLVAELSNIIYGRANIEDEWLSRGGLPSKLCLGLAIQRNCLTKLREKFCDIDDVHKVYLYIGLKLVARVFTNLPLLISDALKNIPSALEYFPRGVESMIADAIREMGIKSDVGNMIDLIRKSCTPELPSAEETKATALLASVRSSRPDMSPKGWRKQENNTGIASLLVTFGRKDEAVAKVLKGVLTQNGLQAQLLENEQDSIGVTVALKK